VELPFLAPPMDEFRNAHVALDAVWGSGVGVLRERLLQAPTPEAKFAVLESTLLSRISHYPEPHAAWPMR